jgi:hypothetical protein
LWGLHPRIGVDDEADAFDLKVVKNSMPQCHNASAPQRQCDDIDAAT